MGEIIKWASFIFSYFNQFCVSDVLMGLLAGLGCLREFLFFFYKVNSVAYLCICKAFCFLFTLKVPIYRVERAGFGRHLFPPSPTIHESKISYIPAI